MNYRLQECGWRKQFRVMMFWQSFEFHEVTRNERRELCVTRDAQLASLNPTLVLCMWMLPGHAYHLREALRGSEKDKESARCIVLSERVVGWVMEFIDTCRNGCLLCSIDDFQAYKKWEGEADENWKAVVQIVVSPPPPDLIEAIDKIIGFLEIVAGCLFDLARAL